MKKLILTSTVVAASATAWHPVAHGANTLRIPGLAQSVITHDLPPISSDKTLEGVELFDLRVPGDPGAWGRLARNGASASGVLVTRTGTTWLGADDAGSLVAISDLDAVARIPLAERVIEPRDVAVDCSSTGWSPVFADHTRLADYGEDRTFTVAFAYDQAYQQVYGEDWQTTLATTISTIDEVLYRDAGIHLEVFEDSERGIGIEEVPASAVASTTGETLDRLQDHYIATYGGQLGETVFLFSGVNFTNAGGQVNCVGSAGRTNVSYGVASVALGDFEYADTIVMLPDPGIKIGAHELGHTLSAHHHYANCVEAAGDYNPIHPSDACTILINDWGLIALRYSSLERLAMMGWADEYEI